jgi:hypothetical protein
MSSQDFTLDAYMSLLKQAKERYKFIDPESALFEQDKGIIWRHDVDFSLRCATEISRIDADLEVTSVFFINIHSDTYNARSALGRSQLMSIAGCGHSIGIHLDSEFYGGFETVDKLEKALNNEVMEFEENFYFTPKSFSFHNPSNGELCFDARQYANLVNYYSVDFKEKFKYVSDSNGYWRFQSISNVVNQSDFPRLQVLTHPEWWADREFAPRERLAKAMFDDAIEDLMRYDQAIVRYSRENISDIRDEEPKNSAKESGVKAFDYIYKLEPE